MEICLDFVEHLGPDTSSCVFTLIDSPADLIRVSAVSRSWRRFVIANGFSKKLCLRMCPEASNVTDLLETNCLCTSDAVSSSDAELRRSEREHRLFSYLGHCIVSLDGNRNCIFQSIHASSTDNFPDESIDNTLEPNDRVDRRPSYWSSEGQSDPQVPETLTYRLLSNLCVIDEIIIQPFKAYFQYGNPIYSASAVRFRMGHSRLPFETAAVNIQAINVDNYVWTYVSPEFPMVQENTLQSFKLPRPALCIGGILQIELLGRVQVQEMDGLYYICVCHVKALGRPLTPKLDVQFVEPAGKIVLRYQPDAVEPSSTEPVAEEEPAVDELSVSWNALRERINHLRARRGWHLPLLNSLLGPAEPESDEEEQP
ncbi:hypothetical protein HPP92_014011 [Vanilla planifolia]|uniref:F-box protein n=1 Tax=Vanilla planifolia TaxID=51239 RepID=A0A835UVT7_VANPL|nr:hypothetical protein HPP92_014011 [Vanilla planifolia]